jgi:hypothetical protein
MLLIGTVAKADGGGPQKGTPPVGGSVAPPVRCAESCLRGRWANAGGQRVLRLTTHGQKTEKAIREHGRMAFRMAAVFVEFDSFLRSVARARD